MPITIPIVYLFLTVFWGAFIVNFFMPLDANIGVWVHWLGIALLVIHVLELLLVGSKLKAIGRFTSRDIGMVLLFGVLYWKPLVRKP